MSNYPKSSNPFGDDEDEGNFGQPARSSTAVQPAKQGGFGGGGGYGQSQPYSSGGGGYSYGGGQSNGRDFDDSGFGQPQSQQSQLEASRQRTMESQQRALKSIYTSEQIGIATAEELMDQGETLNRVEAKVDDIENMQKTSQRQINSLSSIFGGIKNLFSKNGCTIFQLSCPFFPPPDYRAEPTPPADAPRPSQTTRSSDLQSAMQKSSSKSYYQEPAKTDFSDGPKPKSNPQFDDNLDLMSDGMSRLKGLAMGLNSEIETQNQQLDRLGPKMDRTTDTSRKQTGQMNTILYGKGGKK